MGLNTLFHSWSPLFFAVFLTLYFVTLGRILLNRAVRKVPFLESSVLSFSLGVGLVATSIFFLGILGQIRLWTFLSCIFLSWLVSFKETILFLKELVGWIKSLPGRLSPISLIFSLVLLAHCLLDLIYSLAPPIGFDALWWHLMLGKIYAKTHFLSSRPDIVWSFGPQLMELLHTLGIVLHSAILASLLNLTMSLALLGALYQLARRFLSREGALLTACLFWCMPLVVYNVYQMKNDLGMTLFILLACDQWILLTRGDSVTRTFLLLSVFLGLAVACKFTALPYVLVIAMAALWSIRKRWKEPSVRKTILVGVCLMSFCCVPYFIRSYVLTGNPVYPNAYPLFRGRFWDRGADEMSRLEHNSARDLNLFLTYPLRLSTARPFGGHVASPLFLTFLPLLLFLKPVDKLAKQLLKLSFSLYLLSYLSLYVRSRYYLPVLCVLSAPTAYAIQRCWEEKGMLRLIGTFSVALFLSLNFMVTTVLTRQQIPVVFGLESASSYLSRTLPFYRVIQYANEHTQPDERILTFGVPGFYLERDAINASVLTPGAVLFHTLKTPEKLLKRLHELQIRHVILVEKPKGETNYRLDMKMFEQLKTFEALTPVYQAGNAGFYRVEGSFGRGASDLSPTKREREQR